MSRTALGQVGAPAADVKSALNALKEAPAYERKDKRAALVALGDAAVEGLIAAVAEHRETQDASYVGQCILALGELKAQKATDVLIDVLESNRMQFVYQAAWALGSIWQGKGGADDTAKTVNAWLLALVHSELSPPVMLGAALALVKINNMPIPRAESMAADQLASQVDRWIANNPAVLPPFDKRPWQLNLHTALTSQDSAAQQSALQALRQQQPLGCVEPILKELAAGSSATEPVRNDLAQLLGELTGVAFPPEGADVSLSRAELVNAWRWLWFGKLSQQTDPKYVAYTWHELESSLLSYEESPSDSAADSVKYFRSSLIYQLADPDAIPRGTMPKAKGLLTEPLAIKKRIADAMKALEGTPGDFEKTTQLSIIEDQAGKKGGREVGLMFLEALARLARDEGNLNVATQMGHLLSKLSGIPCDLEFNTLDKRRAKLDEWEETLSRAGPTMEAAAE